MHIVSLTSDFGLQDYYVAELKAQIFQRTSEVQIIDVSHSLDSHDIVQAAHFVDNVFRSFPESSIHIIAVYNYYDINSRIIVLEQEGHYFIAPDNGVLSLIFENISLENVRAVDHDKLGLDSVSEMFGYAAAYIASGFSMAEIGPAVSSINMKMGIKPVITKSQIRATIIHIDHYENVVINLKKEQFEKLRNGREFQLYFKQNDPITIVSNDYGELPIGEVLTLFNTAGYMEIAINMGKASSLLNLNKNETIQINFLD